MGLRGDPIYAVDNRKSGKISFGYPVFEGVNPNSSVYMEKAKKLWGRLPTGADFMAGGGSIPFEMSRAGYGEVVAGDLNPVAYILLKAGLEYPAKYGDRLVRDVDRYSKMVLRELREKVRDFFPPHPAGQPKNYIWVKMFKCPTCGCEIPALRTLWLDRKKNVAFYPIIEKGKVDLKIVEVRVIKNYRIRNRTESNVEISEGILKGRVFDTKGFSQGGVLECPAHRHTVEADEVKRQYSGYINSKENEGYFGSHPARLVATVMKRRVYHEPTNEILSAYKHAEEELKNKWNICLTNFCTCLAQIKISEIYLYSI